MTLSTRPRLRPVTKNIFLKSLRCRTLGWFLRNGRIPREPVTPGSAFLRTQEDAVEQKARALFPGGVLVEERSARAAAKRTLALLNDPNVPAIHKAVFLWNDCIASPDILVRRDDGWEWVDVRSSIQAEQPGAEMKPSLLKDAAYACLVLEKCGLPLRGIRVLTLSRDFRLKMDPRRLFVETDRTRQIRDAARDLLPLFERILKATRQKTRPAARLELKCRGCPAFTRCVGKGLKNPILDIPHMDALLFEALTAAGIVRIEDVPEDFSLSDKQRIAVKSVQTGKETAARGLKSRLESIRRPIRYLDFEALMTAIPLYPGVAPYEHLPVQYSVHTCDRPGRVIGHAEYLADPAKDCRPELTRRLIADLKGSGSIVTYSPFERDIILGLAARFPRQAGKLKALARRIVDLAAIVRGYFYHPDFRGKSSIKTILPLLVPGSPYDDLKIASGTSALAAFVDMTAGRYDPERTRAVRRDLLSYCAQDTLSLVLLHERLESSLKHQRRTPGLRSGAGPR